MKQITEKNRRSGAILAYALVPLSGLATDMYLPSFPEMSRAFHVDNVAIQTTLTVFLISYGLGQFFAGTIMDSFGRYRPALIALSAFIVSNILIITAPTIGFIYFYRALQGLCLSFIAVGKRSFFVDAYTGKRQKSYTALVTVVWAVAPIVAPFIGGFLQKYFNWEACFYTLAIYGFILLILELVLSGETLKSPTPFRIKPIVKVYTLLLNTRDFSIGVTLLGVSFCMVIAFNMSIPFIVEGRLHLPAVVTGYCALCSGAAILFGGIIGRKLSINHIFKKSLVTTSIQLVVIMLMFTVIGLLNNLILLMTFVFIIHLIEGVIYNWFFTHCLTRFPRNAATAGGITAGGSYLVLSPLIAILIGILTITNQEKLAVAYLILSLLMLVLMLLFRPSIQKANRKMMRREARAE